jgi:hypothetical protein
MPYWMRIGHKPMPRHPNGLHPNPLQVMPSKHAKSRQTTLSDSNIDLPERPYDSDERFVHLVNVRKLCEFLETWVLNRMKYANFGNYEKAEVRKCFSVIILKSSLQSDNVSK